jgi:hypothetical protein
MLSIGKLSYLAEMQATNIPSDSELDGIPFSSLLCYLTNLVVISIPQRP